MPQEDSASGEIGVAGNPAALPTFISVGLAGEFTTWSLFEATVEVTSISDSFGISEFDVLTRISNVTNTGINLRLENTSGTPSDFRIIPNNGLMVTQTSTWALPDVLTLRIERLNIAGASSSDLRGTVFRNGVQVQQHTIAKNVPNTEGCFLAHRVSIVKAIPSSTSPTGTVSISAFVS